MNTRVLKHTLALGLAFVTAVGSLRETGSPYNALITFTATYAVVVLASWLGLKASRVAVKRR
ncbi:MAG: hypothetical protein QXE66_06615 [Desulfurococcaceae archaeon]